MRVAVINDTGGRGHHGCDLVMAEIDRWLTYNGLDAAWTHPVGVDWRPLAEELLARSAVDAIILNGEGSIHNSATRERAVYLSEFGPFAREVMGVPAYLINATVTAIDNRIAGNLRAFTRLFVRDSGTKRELATYGVDAEVVPDLTVAAIYPELPRERKGVCIVDSVVSETRQALRRAAKRNRWQYRTMRERLEKPSPVDYQGFARFLASHELVVTGRYHTVTMCLATRTPFLAIESNTPKISWLLDDAFGSRRRLIGVRELAKFRPEAFFGWTASEKDGLDRIVSAGNDRTKAMFAAIRSDMGMGDVVAAG